jgi:hypothetical protein
MRRRIVSAFVLACVSCSREPQMTSAPTATAPPPPSAPAPAPSPSPSPTAKAPRRGPGETITVRGRVSTLIAQHMTTDVPGKQHGYFDVSGGGGQMVVYWKTPPSCPGEIELTGKTILLRGPSKRPGRDTKLDDTYSELHLDVETARCVD